MNRLGLARWLVDRRSPTAARVAVNRVWQSIFGVGIVETAEGLHIVRIDDKKPRQFRPFEQVKTEIQSLVFQQKTEDQYQLWMADLKNKAYIEIKF